MRSQFVLTAFLLLLSAPFLTNVDAQMTTEPLSIGQILDAAFLPEGQPAFDSLFPEPFFSTQTPLVIRYVVLVTVGRVEVGNACEKGSLSFFGTDDEIPEEFCDYDNLMITSSYIIYKLLSRHFPNRGAFYGRFLERQGLEPFSDSMDKTTKIGWANVAAKRLNDYFDNDGWNSLGDLSKENYPQIYEDYSGYEPVNPPHLKPEELVKPLRWQPLTQSYDLRGNYASQVHVVPHIGPLAKPLAFTRENLNKKTAPGPYVTPERKGSLGKQDMKIMEKQIEELFEISRNITPEQIVSAYWWENKLASLGGFITYYQFIYKFGRRFHNRILFSEAVAQHDATLLAWKEKRNHDLVRPPTAIRKLYKGKMVRASKGFKKGVGLVKAEEWEPVLRVQPHSEYPSGSSTICQATMDHLSAALSEVVPKNETLPPFDLTLEPFINQFTNAVLERPITPVDFPVRIFFPTPQDAAIDCGMSRLYAGIHFKPSVMDGFELGSGVGQPAFKHFKDLQEGKVPEDCVRCGTVDPIKM